MSDYRDGIHCQIDPQQIWQSPAGRRVQEVSVVMADGHRFDSRRGRGGLAPAICALTPPRRASWPSSCSSPPNLPSAAK